VSTYSKSPKETNSAPERFNWAVTLMKIKPTDTLLEIGCGSGILAEQVALKLDSGKIIALDQSQAMINMAVKRNKDFIEAGQAEFIAHKFATAGLPNVKYDKIFAFNVSTFWKNPETELQIVRMRLKKTSGRLFLFHLPPNESARKIAVLATEKLSACGFDVIETVFEKFDGISAFCLISKPC
jgi:cyclopropane fatty-acyl-phospholipid synthase-like methyltransferase